MVSPTRAPPRTPLAEGKRARGAGAFQERRLVPGAGRVPQGRRFADAQDAPLAEQSGAGGVEVHHGDDGTHRLALKRAPAGWS